MEREARQLRSETLKMCWYMRGGITYNEAMRMTSTEREIIGTIIKDNLETTKKTRMPFF
jgi:hypothetical protein